MNTQTMTETIDRESGPTPGPAWAFYVLAVYPLVFLGGMIVAVGVFLTTTDPSLYTSGLTGGFIVVGLSALAVLTYPAYRTDSTALADRGATPRPFRRFLAIGLGVPIAIGVLLELIGFGVGGGLNVPGFMAGFVAIVVHPVVVFFLTIGYLLRRRRYTG